MKDYNYWGEKKSMYILHLGTSWYSYNQIPREVKQDTENSAIFLVQRKINFFRQMQ